MEHKACRQARIPSRLILIHEGGGMGKGASVKLSVDGKQVAEGRIEKTVGRRFPLDETWDVGEDTGTPVEFATYDVPFRFSGELKKLIVDLKQPDAVAEKELQKSKQLAGAVRD